MIPAYGRFGGKRLIAKEIVSLIPTGKYTTYVEPFFGAGAVFFQIPKGQFKEEIINDKDPIVYSLIKGFQKYKGDTINKKVNGSYTKEEFLSIRDSEPKTQSGEFRKNFILSRVSYLGQMTHYNIARKNITRNFDDRYKERLKGVKIYNKDYTDIIKEYDTPNTFFYFDPPYEKSKNLYKFSVFNPFQFLDEAKNLQGDFILSYNYNEELKKYAENLGYEIRLIQTKYSAKSKTVKHKQIEELLIIRIKP